MLDVSIVIPTYNRADYLSETLDSVSSQTNQNWECIIIDDGSSDNSEEIINHYISSDSRFSFYSRIGTGKAKGASSCRNIGIQKAKGQYVIFLDSDDLLLDNCIASRLDNLKNSKAADFYIFKMQVLKHGKLGRVIGAIPTENTPESYLKMIFQGIQPFTVTSILWKREALIGLEGFDEKLERMEDPDLHLRAYYKNYEYVHFDKYEPDCLYRMDEDYKKKFQDKRFLRIVCNSFLYFTKKHIELLKNSSISKENINTWLRNWTLHFFKDYFLKFNNLSAYIKFARLVAKAGIFSSKEFFTILLVMLYVVTGLDKVKGLGYYTLQKRLFNKTR